MSKEIVKACVKYQDRLYTGFEHGECFSKLNDDNTIIVFEKIEQGFIDNEGNFVDRKQAMIIARESGQLSYETDKQTLISEDLHLDWLKKQDQKIKELEHRLSNCIEPKFKVGQKVYHLLCDNEVKEDFIESNHHLCSLKISRFGIYEDYLFATEEEAKKHLEELKNG